MTDQATDQHRWGRPTGMRSVRVNGEPRRVPLWCLRCGLTDRNPDVYDQPCDALFERGHVTSVG